MPQSKFPEGSGSVKLIAKNLRDIQTYQELAYTTANFPEHEQRVHWYPAESEPLSAKERLALSYAGLALGGETGELLEVLKKMIYNKTARPGDRQKILHEMGDVLWGLSAVGTVAGISLQEAAEYNLLRLAQLHAENEGRMHDERAK
jgi:NTP pyrophosphatase (non-canonical NTP hydrolase)